MKPPLPNMPESDPDREEMVAYLDGELGDDARRRVERRLAEDSSFRTALNDLSRS